MAGNYQSVEPGIPKAAQDQWGKMSGTGNRMSGELSNVGFPTQTLSRYQGQGVAPMNQWQNSGLQGLNSWAMQPGATESGANNLINQTMRGDFLNAGNPYMSKMTDAMSQNMSRGINAASQGLGEIFGKAGVSYRGPAETNMRRNALSDFSNSMTNMYGQNYANERSNMQNILPQAMSFANQPANRYSTLMNAGQTPYDISQAGNTFNYNDWTRMGGAQTNAWQMPFNIQSQMMQQMPLSYPQQQYNKGLLDYAMPFAQAWMMGGA